MRCFLFFWLQYFWLLPSLCYSWFFLAPTFLCLISSHVPVSLLFLAPILYLSSSLPFLIFLAPTFLGLIPSHAPFSLVLWFLFTFFFPYLLSSSLFFLFSPFFLFSLPSFFFFGSWTFFGSEPGSPNTKNLQAWWPVWLWICTSKFLTIHSRIATCIKQALNTTDVHNFYFLLLWLSELQIAALSKASMQDIVLYGACLTSVYLWSTAQSFHDFCVCSGHLRDIYQKPLWGFGPSFWNM